MSIPATVVITLVTIIFTAGVTWGLTTSRTKNNSSHIESVVQDLKTVVGKLQDMATDIQVAKTISELQSRNLDSLNDRVRVLEAQVAKLTA